MKARTLCSQWYRNKKIIRELYEQLYTSKSGNSEEMNTFLEHLNRPITSRRLNQEPKRKVLNFSDFTGEFY
jgi:type IV secretory pathway VirD2 relaxase